MAGSIAVRVRQANGRAKRITAKAKRSKVLSLRTHKTAKARKAAPILSSAQREALVLKYRLKARKLARSILRKWHARLDLQEVDSVVDLSLCEAVRRFNPKKGASFITFFYYHLKGNLIRAVSEAANAHAVPGLSEQEVVHTSQVATGDFHATASDVAEALVSDDYESPDEMLFRRQMAHFSSLACNRLDPLEREVIYRIYVKEQQLMEIARTLGYSRCHISRVKRQALESLHRELRDCVGAEILCAEFAGDDDLDLQVISGGKLDAGRARARSRKILRSAQRDELMVGVAA